MFYESNILSNVFLYYIAFKSMCFNFYDNATFIQQISLVYLSCTRRSYTGRANKKYPYNLLPATHQWFKLIL